MTAKAKSSLPGRIPALYAGDVSRYLWQHGKARNLPGWVDHVFKDHDALVRFNLEMRNGISPRPRPYDTVAAYCIKRPERMSAALWNKAAARLGYVRKGDVFHLAA